MNKIINFNDRASVTEGRKEHKDQWWRGITTLKDYTKVTLKIKKICIVNYSFNINCFYPATNLIRSSVLGHSDL